MGNSRPSRPSTTNWRVEDHGALHVTAPPGDGRAAVVLLDVGVVLIGWEMRGGMRGVGGEPAGRGRPDCGVAQPVPEGDRRLDGCRIEPPWQERCAPVFPPAVQTPLTGPG